MKSKVFKRGRRSIKKEQRKKDKLERAASEDGEAGTD